MAANANNPDPTQASNGSHSHKRSHPSSLLASGDKWKADGVRAGDLDNWQCPTPEELRKELSHEFSEQERSEVWSDAAEAVKTHYDELVRRWKEEMDTLLVYAGLFSAVLTAFNVESYQLLQPGPSDATVAGVLEEISARLNSFTVSPPFVNSTHARIPHTPFQAPPSAVWINALWFSSLVCSLASASITLIVKQWLHETVVGLSGTSREIARLRQHRLHGLIKWRVGTIIVALPTLLQLALVLFLVGMLILLWTLHSAVAVLTSILIAVLFTFFVVVTILPTVKWDCCYRSP
ncbi:hypothetical protein C8Q76DRAFT_418885 [Earliella scabrosa]|nr:hypothetical protein C8Q76DRAFT_418885 [Earliella scabrosa]